MSTIRALVAKAGSQAAEAAAAAETAAAAGTAGAGMAGAAAAIRATVATDLEANLQTNPACTNPALGWAVLEAILQSSPAVSILSRLMCGTL